jgi:hypothetical protein
MIFLILEKFILNWRNWQKISILYFWSLTSIFMNFKGKTKWVNDAGNTLLHEKPQISFC